MPVQIRLTILVLKAMSRNISKRGAMKGRIAQAQTVAATALLVAAMAQGEALTAASDVRLLEAVQRQDRAAIETLLEQQIDVNTRRGGWGDGLGVGRSSRRPRYGRPPHPCRRQCECGERPGGHSAHVGGHQRKRGNGRDAPGGEGGSACGPVNWRNCPRVCRTHWRARRSQSAARGWRGRGPSDGRFARRPR